jgi:hypothetical protein
LNNSGNLDVDIFHKIVWHGFGPPTILSDGGSTLTLGGTLTHTGTVDIGNVYSKHSTTVTAEGLNNTGTMTLAGASGAVTQLTIAGQTTNSGSVTIGTGSTLAVTGAGHSYAQHGGTTIIAGTLAGTVNADGGLIDFKSALTSGDGTGALNVGTHGKLEFEAAVAQQPPGDFYRQHRDARHRAEKAKTAVALILSRAAAGGIDLNAAGVLAAMLSAYLAARAAELEAEVERVKLEAGQSASRRRCAICMSAVVAVTRR